MQRALLATSFCYDLTSGDLDCWLCYRLTKRDRLEISDVLNATAAAVAAATTTTQRQFPRYYLRVAIMTVSECVRLARVYQSLSITRWRGREQGTNCGTFYWIPLSVI